MTDIPKSAVITFDRLLCTGCGTCELMCSLYHEGLGGPALSRAHVDRNPFDAEFSFHACRQCLAPSCLAACPLGAEAICIDAETGARFVNEEACTGCGECVQACPFDPPEIRLNEEANVAFKCDLCRNRTGGPICVEYCPAAALAYTPANER